MIGRALTSRLRGFALTDLLMGLHRSSPCVQGYFPMLKAQLWRRARS